MSTLTKLKALDRECYPDKPLTRDQWKRATAGVGGLSVGIEEEGRAYYLIQKARDAGGPLVRLLRLGVAEGERGQGLAKGLLAGLEGVNCEAVVSERNLAGLKLLTGCGFSVGGLLGEEKDRVWLWRAAGEDRD